MKPINVIKYLNEEDHERKHKDYSNASQNFDDTSLNEDMTKSDNRVSEIDLVRKSVDDREYDLDFYDKLEELNYEYILNYDGKLFYRQKSLDDDIIIIDYEHGTMIKVDHNGESLFFNEKEVALLDKDLEEE